MENFEMTLSNMWILMLGLTIITAVIFNWYKDFFKLGITALKTWGGDKTTKLHEEHGRFRTLMATLSLVLVGYHLAKMLFLWVLTITWTLGLWEPPA